MLLLHLLTASEPAPAWMVEPAKKGKAKAKQAAGHAARRAAAADRFASLPPAEALSEASPQGSRAALEILRGALNTQIEGYERSSADDAGLDPAKRLHAGRLVAGELRIWTAALGELDSLAGGAAAGRGAKQAKRNERAPLEPWEVVAAVCASRKRRRD